ncbi:MAG: YfdQ family protein [Parvularculaceae bacterium]|nr:YfdQ family protein [Parvularculaceae bacterium]
MAATEETTYPYTNLFDTALRAAKAVDVAPFGAPGGRSFVALPRGFELKDVSDPALLAPHPAASLVFDERQALVDYVNRFRDDRSVVFADVDAAAITAEIDYHDPCGSAALNSTGARRHKATLKLRESEEFRRWDAFEGALHAQAEFADFLEENASDIGEPDPATMIELAREFSATVGAKFDGKVDLSSGDRRFRYETETRVAETIRVPRGFVVQIPIWAGEDAEPLQAAFRYRVSAGGLSLGFEWRRVGYRRLARFRLIAFAVAEATGAPVFMGRAG